MKHYTFTLLTTLILSACSSVSEDIPVSASTESQHTFNAIGYAPINAQPGESFDLKILNAIKASKLEAYREMAEQVYGVLVVSDNSAEGAILGEDSMKAEVKGLVRGARVVRSYHEGDVYITELELNTATLPFLKESEFNQRGGSVIRVEETVYY